MTKNPLEHLEYKDWIQVQENLEEMIKIGLTHVETKLHILLIALKV